MGGFRFALEREGYECVGWCEIDRHAQKLYRAYFRPKKEEVFYEDAREIDPRSLPDFDILVAGFPCPSFSISGKRLGFKDERGTLFFEIARIASVKRPAYLLLENVKGLLSHDGGRTFEILLKTLDELGYDAEWQVLNSKDFGVPQHRERVFIIGHLRGRSSPSVFPLAESDRVYYQPPKKTRGEGQQLRCSSDYSRALDANYKGGAGSRTHIIEVKRIKGLGDGTQGYRVYDPSGLAVTLKANAGGGGAKTGLYVVRKVGNIYPSNGQAGNVYDPEGLSPSLVSGCGTDGHWGGGVPLTLEGFAIRKLTPLECFRLQGFPDEMYHLARDLGIADMHLYRMTGNAVTVQVVQSIARKLKELEEYI